jgi:hypothetical protein
MKQASFKSKRNENENAYLQQKPNDAQLSSKNELNRKRRNDKSEAVDESLSFTNRRLRKKLKRVRSFESSDAAESNSSPEPNRDSRIQSKLKFISANTRQKLNKTHKQERPERRKLRYFNQAPHRVQSTTKPVLVDFVSPKPKNVVLAANRQSNDEVIPTGDFDKTIYESFYELLGSTK